MMNDSFRIFSNRDEFTQHSRSQYSKQVNTEYYILDSDIREVIDILDDPASVISEGDAELFAARLGATVVKILSTPYQNEWKVELKIPSTVRRLHMPLPGDPVCSIAKAGIHEHEVTGTYQFQRDRSYVILDDAGGEWEVQSMWQMKK